MIWLILLFVVLVLIALFIKRRKKTYNEIWKYLDAIPEPKSYPILGTNHVLHTPESMFIRDRNRAKEFWPIYKLWSFGLYTVVLLHPEDIELVLNNTKHLSKSYIYSFLHEWLGTGLLTSTGKKWHKRRKILTPAFHFNILQEFLEMLNNETDILVDNLKMLCDAPYVDVLKPITEFTLYSIGETSLGVPLREDPNCLQYKQAIFDIGENFQYRAVRPWLYIPFIYKLSNLYRRDTDIITVLHNFSKNVIQKRKETISTHKTMSYSNRKRLALLDLMLKARKDGEDIDDDGIREELDTFIFEGHDTTSISICLTLMVLANEPYIQNEIYEEITSVLGENEHLSFNDLRELKILERCIKESLRLYPSVPVIGRVAGEEIHTKTGYIIPKNCNVIIDIYGMHRSRIYENPEKFDPDRFLLENVTNRHPFSYLPFSAGSRNCIGQRFAIMELKICLSGILKYFKLEPVTKPEDIIYKSDLVLRVKGELKVKFIPRSKM